MAVLNTILSFKLVIIVIKFPLPYQHCIFYSILFKFDWDLSSSVLVATSFLFFLYHYFKISQPCNLREEENSLSPHFYISYDTGYYQVLVHSRYEDIS